MKLSIKRETKIERIVYDKLIVSASADIDSYLAALGRPYMLVIEPHEKPRNGFSAYFMRSADVKSRAWGEVGHGDTIEDAVSEAYSLFVGALQYSLRQPGEFMKTPDTLGKISQC